jgi:hypothetical protein
MIREKVQDMTEEEAGKVVVCTLGLVVILFCAVIFL